MFSILFGSRHVDVTERHEGLVAAIAFESIVKLVAFLAVGIFVTYELHYGIRDLVAQAKGVPQLENLFTLPSGPGAYTNWAFQIFVSMMAILFLPRQFQMAVVENINEKHLNKAIWLFPLYLMAINIFVLPIAIAGVLHFPGPPVDPDTFVLKLPMAEHKTVLTLLVFIGGMSASTGMVIVATIALSTMISNYLVMPVLLRLRFLQLSQQTDLSNILLIIRWASIVLVILFGYVYFRFIGEFYPLVSIGIDLLRSRGPIRTVDYRRYFLERRHPIPVPSADLLPVSAYGSIPFFCRISPREGFCRKALSPMVPSISPF